MAFVAVNVLGQGHARQAEAGPAAGNSELRTFEVAAQSHAAGHA